MTTEAILRSGETLQAPGLYASNAPGLHVPRPLDSVADPFTEGRTALATTWSQNRTAAVFQALGNEGAARDAAFLMQCGDPANAWLVSTGSTQVGELVLVGRDSVGLADR